MALFKVRFEQIIDSNFFEIAHLNALTNPEK
jgi:hypothetical protein